MRARAASSSETTLIWSPARAGKTRALSLRFLTGWVHPHMCEENTYQIPVWICGPGSSPRVRGKLRTPPAIDAAAGLIPAHAGKTSVPRSKTRSLRAHPRVCGENRPGRPRIVSTTGSSPRVRGKQRCLLMELPAFGLIPACAGKTESCGCSTSVDRAHPRVCGENAPFLSCPPIITGSSPRVRGKRARECPPSWFSGLIPACAGKTYRKRACGLLERAHPRVCGENICGDNISH